MPPHAEDHEQAATPRWHFGAPLPPAFEEHIRRSVPLYAEGHQLILELSDFFVGQQGQAGDAGVVYDIGCSTGLLLKQLAARHTQPGLRFVGIDAEADMVEYAREQTASDPRIEIRHASVADPALYDELAPADLIVSYYTMQFVPPRRRQAIFDQLYATLEWGGALLLFEKVRGPDARFQDIATQLYTEYKRRQGYGSDEILNKSRALKGVLEPFSTRGNLDLLGRAGFVDITTILKYICFEGFFAIK